MYIIYFESGFSYSKGVKVIPIGINGIDVGKLAPPISLLQGFNISSYEGLNNIISILNSEFSCSYNMNFSEIDFNTLNGKELNSLKNFDEIIGNIDYFNFEFGTISSDNEKYSINENSFVMIKQYFEKKGIFHIYRPHEKKILLHGMEITLKESTNDRKLYIKLDPIMYFDHIHEINNLRKEMYSKEFDRIWFEIIFKENVKIVREEYKVSSKLYKSGFNMVEGYNGHFKFENILFKVETKEINSRPKSCLDTIRILLNIEDVAIVQINQLVETLYTTGIISF